MTFPSTSVKLLSNIPLSNAYEHQRTFTDETEQYNYFISKVSCSLNDDFSYVREEIAIKVPVGYDNLYDCNYVMYKNNDYSSKWFYAFVTKREYINPNTTKLYLELDVFQTYQFSMTFLSSFVEREHCQRWNTDGTPVINTIPENLEMGTEYDTVKNEVYQSTGENYYLITCTTDLSVVFNGVPPDTPPMPSAKIIQGLLTGLNYYIIQNDPNSQDNALNQILTALQDKSQYLQCILSIAYLPEECVPKEGLSSINLSGVTANIMQVNQFNSNIINDNVLNVGKYDGFPQVDESKLLMYPYSFSQATAYNGDTLEIKNEYITGNDLQFQTWGYCSADTRLAYVLKNYNNDTSLNNALIIKDFPQLPIASSMYQQYLAQNTMQNTMAVGMGIIGMAASTAMLFNPATAMAGGFGLLSGAQGIMDNLAKQQDAKKEPNTLQTQSGGSGFNVANGIKGFTVKKKMIKPEYRTILSNFWKSYGYKVNQMKVPNLFSRSNFNYIKTTGANIVGNIPMESLLKLKMMFNNGITLWHGDYIGDYSLPNREV